jgi:hypothetical protein
MPGPYTPLNQLPNNPSALLRILRNEYGENNAGGSTHPLHIRNRIRTLYNERMAAEAAQQPPREMSERDKVSFRRAYRNKMLLLSTSPFARSSEDVFAGILRGNNG